MGTNSGHRLAAAGYNLSKATLPFNLNVYTTYPYRHARNRTLGS